MRILITGATGFIGNAFASRLLGGGGRLKPAFIRAAGRKAEAAAKLIESGAEFMAGDVADPDYARKAVEGVEIVVHCAGRSGLGGPMKLYRRANVEGTRVLLDAARAAGVRRVVNIGTPSIYFDYTNALDRTEDYPLPPKAPDAYAASKLEAELALLAANGPGIETLSLRPRFTTGRGETNILPRFIRMRKSGKLKRIGSGENLVDFTAISNLCDALELACVVSAGEALGQAYNITNGDPVKLWPFIDRLLEKAGLPPVDSKVPLRVAMAAGSVVEFLFRLKGAEPPLTRLGAAVMGTSMTMSIANARRLLGYEPEQGNEAMLEEFIEG